MGRGHGRSAEARDRRVTRVPRGCDRLTRCEQVHARTEVREARTPVVGCGCADGDDARFTRGRSRASVHVVVARRDRERDPVGDTLRHTGVDDARVTAAERHVGDCRHAGLVVIDHPVDAGKNHGPRAPAAASEDAHRDERDLLRHTPRCGADGAGHVGSVSHAVVRAVAVRDGCEPRLHASTELSVSGADAGVDHVRGDAGSVSRVGVLAGERQRTLVDAVQAPRRI